MTRNVELLCIGNALVDVFAAADEETAARFGITRPVQHIEIEKIQELLSTLPEWNRLNLSGEIDTAGPPENLPPDSCSSGHARETPAGHRACPENEINTASPPENLPLVSYSSGGGAANVAKIAGLLGARVRFIGAIGKGKAEGAETGSDQSGRIFGKDLRGAGVELRLPLKASPTGICLMLRTGNETRVAASPSAALELSESDIGGEDIQGAKLVVIDGFMLGRPGIVRRVLELAGSRGIPAALDLSSPSAAKEHAALIVDYARRYPLILFMNEAEALAFYDGLKTSGFELSGSEGEGGGETPPFLFEDGPDENAGIRRIYPLFRSLSGGGLLRELPAALKNGAVPETRASFREEISPREPGSCSGPRQMFPLVVVKLGPGGALCFAGGVARYARTREVIPLESTGAGDSFSAAFLTAWLRNKTLEECAALGNRTARITLDAMGTKITKEQLEEIAALLRENT